MEKHPFRTAKESGSSTEKFAALFTPDIRFKSPIFVKPLVGQDIVLSVLLNAGEVIGARSYLDEFRQGDKTALTWEGMVEGYPLYGVDLIIDESDGLVKELAVTMRPFPVVGLFREAMFLRLESVLPPDVWELEAL